MQLEADVVQHAAATEPAHGKQRPARGGVGLAQPLLPLDLAQHQPHHLGRRDRGDGAGADGLAVAHHRDAVADMEDLVEEVRDVDNRRAAPP